MTSAPPSTAPVVVNARANTPRLRSGSEIRGF